MRLFWATSLAVVAGVVGGWMTRGRARPPAPVLRPATDGLLAEGGSDDLMTRDEGDYLVSAGADTRYVENPPTSGPQYESWAAWGSFTESVPRGVWVHNLAHGGVAYLYRPDARPGVIAALRRDLDALAVDGRCGHAWTLMTPDPELDLEWAVVSWGHVLTARDVDDDAVIRFTRAHRGERAQKCAPGDWAAAKRSVPVGSP